MPEGPRYASLQDYLGLLRRQRWLILAITIVFAVAAYVHAKGQDEKYSATADVTIHDIADDLRVVGINATSNIAPAQQAEQAAEVAGGLDAARSVQKSLKSDLSPRDLQGDISTHVGTLTGLLQIEAQTGSPSFSAKLADAYAKEVVHQQTQRAVARIDATIRSLKKRAGPPNKVPTTISGQQAQSDLSNLLTVRDILSPAEISRPAEVPTDPISPRPTRDTILGALVGLALALGVAFVRDALDRRIRGSRQAHDELDLPVIGRVGVSALGTGRFWSNGRDALSPPDMEAFRILRANIAHFDKSAQPRVLLVTSGKPGEGKSTVAAALASASAAAGQNTLLVEADLRQPSLARRMGLTRVPGLSEYLAGQAGPSEILQLYDVHRGSVMVPGEDTSAQLVAISAGKPRENSAELLATSRARDFLAKVRKVYDLVVLDSSPLLAAADPLELVPHVDGIILCVRVGSSTRDEVRAAKEALERLPRRPTGIVITGIKAGDDEYANYGYARAVTVD